ncbi:MAG: hypothetical protein JWR58_5412 [Pseudonocardia sp.]|jgi:hypothetical protein|nr:hypothetical protein [Pseudonocardia sp.]
MQLIQACPDAITWHCAERFSVVTTRAAAIGYAIAHYLAPQAETPLA